MVDHRPVPMSASGGEAAERDAHPIEDVPPGEEKSHGRLRKRELLAGATGRALPYAARLRRSPVTPTSLIFRTSLAVSICSLGLGAAMCASPSGSPPGPSPSPGGAAPRAPSTITSTSPSVPRLTPGDLVPLA